MNSGLDLAFVVFFNVIALVSVSFYLSDRAPKFYEGKAIPISRVAGSSWIIRVCLYSTMIINNLVLIKPSPIYLVLWKSDTAKIAGMLLGAVGISIFVLAKVTLGEHYTPCFNSFIPRALVNRSVYRFVRHPLYLGNLLIYAGVFVGLGSIWSGVSLLTMAALYHRSSKLEESALTHAFSEYISYQEMTGAFIPRILGASHAKAKPRLTIGVDRPASPNGEDYKRDIS
jgi:protein-S-isoprenylcysteine O-methyltransferase Ste14